MIVVAFILTATFFIAFGFAWGYHVGNRDRVRNEQTIAEYESACAVYESACDDYVATIDMLKTRNA